MRIQLSVCVFLLAHMCGVPQAESRGFGGFRGGSFRGGSFRGGSLRGGNKSGGSRGLRQRGSFRHRTIPSLASRHTLYVRNGGLNGGRTASWNGFGLGLGSGLLIGYGTGLLVRPSPLAFLFRYHSHPQSHEKEPMTCFYANSTAFINNEIIVGNIVMTEAREICPSNDHVCLGSMTIIQSNLTVSDDNETFVLYQVKVEKRCISLTELNETFDEEMENTGTFRCWTSPLTSLKGDQSMTFFSNSTFGKDESEIPPRLLATSKIEENDITSVSISFQSETCYCISHLCNVTRPRQPSTGFKFALITLEFVLMSTQIGFLIL